MLETVIPWEVTITDVIVTATPTSEVRIGIPAGISACTPAAVPTGDPNYADGCVPPYPPDVDCADIRALGIAPVRVIGDDPHRLDGDGDGWGCE